MTTNKPEVVAHLYSDRSDPHIRGVSVAYDNSCHSVHVDVEPLIRLSDYEALQAECEQLRDQRNTLAEYKIAAHQLIGIPSSVGITEPVEGFADRPERIMPTVRDMALRIEELERQAAEVEQLRKDAVMAGGET